jgi:hypothetical protein
VASGGGRRPAVRDTWRLTACHTLRLVGPLYQSLSNYTLAANARKAGRLFVRRSEKKKKTLICMKVEHLFVGLCTFPSTKIDLQAIRYRRIKNFH